MNQDFEIQDNILIKYHGNSKKVIVPEGVTAIGKEAFHWCESVTEIILPEGITSIGEGAFWYCINLETVSIPETVDTIGEKAFLYCKKLLCIVIPQNVKAIEECTFEGCENLKSVILPEGLETIEHCAFSNCKSLTSIHLPESLKNLGYIAFLSCSGLKRIPLMLTDGTVFYTPENGQDIPDYRMCDMIRERNYTAMLNLDVKYDLIFQMYRAGIDEEGISAYLKKNFPKMFRWLIDNENIEIIQKILDSGMFVTKRNIDKFIQYAIDNQKHQAQMFLTNYKYQHFEFKSAGEKLVL